MAVAVRVVQVASVSPLTVLEPGASTAVPARQVTVTTGDQAYAPADGDMVLVVFDGRVFWLIGRAG